MHHRLVSRLTVLALTAVASALLMASGCDVHVDPAAPNPPSPVEEGDAPPPPPEGGRAWALSQPRILTNDGEPYNYFGWRIAVSGDTALVGAYRGNGDKGAGYVYTWNGRRWVQQARLTASDPMIDDFLGGAVAVSGDVAALGASSRPSGAAIGGVYVYQRVGTRWRQAQRLIIAEAPGFGASVAVTADTLAAGAYDLVHGLCPDVVYVYAKGAAGWGARQDITTHDAAEMSCFGTSVALEGDTLVVGAPYDSEGPRPQAGAVYVFERSGGVWTQRARLVASDASAGRLFGWSVALQGDRLVAGAVGAGGAFPASRGAAYVFSRSGGAWVEQQKLTVSDAQRDTKGYRVGGDVAIDGDTIALGRFHVYSTGAGDDPYSNGAPGTAYVFGKQGDTWVQRAELSATQPANGDWFGSAVAVKGNTVFVGCVECDTEGDNDLGAVFVFADRKTNGSACASGAECSSGACVDGACCDGPCDGVCEACSARKKGYGADGACEPIQASADPDGECAEFTCDGEGACRERCASTSECAPLHFCAREACAIAPVDAGATGGCSASRGPAGGYALRAALGLLAALALARRRGRRGARSARRRIAAVAPALSLALWPLEANAQPIATEELTELTEGTSAQASAAVGAAVALDRDTAAVGAPLRAAGAGAVLVFSHAEGAWAPFAISLAAPMPAAGDSFGAGLALQGDTLVVGAPGDDEAAEDAGAVYVFRRSAQGEWVGPQKLMALDRQAGARFGQSIALEGDTLVVGAPRSDTEGGVDAGAAYVFERRDGWIQAQRLTQADALPPSDHFGAAVALDGGDLVIGAPGDGEQGGDAGAAYVFSRAGDLWGAPQKLTADDASPKDALGGALSVSAGKILFGVPEASDGRGVAYVATRGADDGAWGKLVKLVPEAQGPGDRFGAAVGLLKSTALVGAPLGDVGQHGAASGGAYLFAWRDGRWQEQPPIAAQDAQQGDRLGASIALTEGTALVGALGKDVRVEQKKPPVEDAGAAYLVLVGSPPQCLGATHSADEAEPGVQPAVVDCFPGTCAPSSGRCITRCRSTEECAVGFFCDPKREACVTAPKSDVGPTGGCGLRSPPGDAQAAMPGAAVFLLSGLLFARRRGGGSSPR